VVRKITSNPSQIAIILKPRTARSGLLSFNPEVSADLAGKLIGADAGVMVAALAQIEQTGLSLQQIKNVGSGLISYLEEAKRVCSPSPRRQALGSFASRFQATTSSRRLLVRKPFS